MLNRVPGTLPGDNPNASKYVSHSPFLERYAWHDFVRFGALKLDLNHVKSRYGNTPDSPDGHWQPDPPERSGHWQPDLFERVFLHVVTSTGLTVVNKITLLRGKNTSLVRDKSCPSKGPENQGLPGQRFAGERPHFMLSLLVG